LGFRTNCLSQRLHLYFCLPLPIDPFFTIFIEQQFGQLITFSIKISLLLNSENTVYHIIHFSGQRNDREEKDE